MKLIEFLKREEGLRLTAYKDTRGIWTIGYGQTGPHVVEGLTITPGQAEAWLEARAAKASSDASMICGQETWRRIGDARQVALASMAYQMGASGLGQFRRTLGAIRDFKWSAAAGFMLESLWHRQTPARAERAAHMILTGTFPAKW